ncbi:MAG TPA: dihydroorotate dehydrogenase electron transfer subunit [Vicinamibacterales bacterium]|nr:dihydroorotate dehydrogenase electron transfer subunit [Vicinamibacterales bacterium]HPW20119.1 dihydroorotate dehydrogenase electron transfer subunit [Vicinamibacterales bacterium]
MAPADVQAEVLGNRRLSADYNVLLLDAPAIAAAARPGQFVMIRTGPGTDPLLRRPFSVFEIVGDGGRAPSAFSVLCKRVGPGTERLYRLEAGGCLSVLGPLGKPFDLVAPPAEAWMVAGGVGLAPFAALAGALRASGVACRLFYGARTAADLFYLDDFAARGVALDLATEDGSRGTRGLVTAPLEIALRGRPAGAAVTLYACGPEPMLKAVAALAGAHGCASQVSTERVMACGMGGCYSCVVSVRDSSGRARFVRSCLDGPVFDGAAVAWD